MDDIVHLILVLKDGRLFIRLGDLCRSPMRLAVQPERTAVLSGHQWQCTEQQRLHVISIDPPVATPQDGRAVVLAATFRAKVVREPVGLVGDVVELQLVFHKERKPDLGFPGGASKRLPPS